MYKLQETMESALQDILSDCALIVDADEFDSKIAQMISDISDEVSRSILVKIRKDAPSEQRHRHRNRKQFENRLRKHWKKPLDLLNLFIELAREAGTDFNSEFRNEAVKSGDAVFEALTRLHARACQISSAILTLLQSGYADDAHARWRSLHEISVVSYFIQKNGQEVAQRYLLHEVIQQFRLAESYQKHHKRIEHEPISEEEFDTLKSKRDQLVGKFGKNFEEEYGWAASALKPERPSIRAIEAHVKLDHMRPYYKMASDNEHPNSHGIHFRLGLSQWNRDVLLAGPSNMGLADPGHSTAISLNNVTTALLATRSSLDCLVVMEILGILTDEIGEEFLKAHREAEAMAMAEAEWR